MAHWRSSRAVRTYITTLKRLIACYDQQSTARRPDKTLASPSGTMPDGASLIGPTSSWPDKTGKNYRLI
ncbi:hypothetical protein CIT292_08658 [Citrobacter youngae ATCC 29220]|uniref:Uncharacterized protein n=1 Tax=Citrobacter youngae ATCC 29220 TaxID=500640 RepID=D4BDU1_9ENTR|nr:hypothetical protein CIT292_08658 [Citrobacter youngae ATCC 29220]